MSRSSFRDLAVWQQAKQLAVEVYRVSSEGPLGRNLGLRDQMRRARVSICRNIAEGNERSTDRDTLRFLYQAKGSASEILTQIEIAAAVGFLSRVDPEHSLHAAEEVARGLGGLIKARQQSAQAHD